MTTTHQQYTATAPLSATLASAIERARQFTSDAEGVVLTDWMDMTLADGQTVPARVVVRSVPPAPYRVVDRVLVELRLPFRADAPSDALLCRAPEAPLAYVAWGVRPLAREGRDCTGFREIRLRGAPLRATQQYPSVHEAQSLAELIEVTRQVLNREITAAREAGAKRPTPAQLDALARLARGESVAQSGAGRQVLARCEYAGWLTDLRDAAQWRHLIGTVTPLGRAKLVEAGAVDDLAKVDRLAALAAWERGRRAAIDGDGLVRIARTTLHGAHTAFDEALRQVNHVAQTTAPVAEVRAAFTAMLDARATLQWQRDAARMAEEIAGVEYTQAHPKPEEV